MIGKQVADHTKWEMYISKTGVDSFEEFLWFEGTSAIDEKSGQWILYHSHDYPAPTIQIDWVITGGEAGEIKYTYIRENNTLNNPDNFYGSYLVYGIKDEAYDRYVNIHAYNTVKNSFADTFVEWSSMDYSGHVKAEHHFGDSEWHCWDSEGNNSVCDPQ